MAPKVVIFTGAPLSAALDWEETQLFDGFCEPIARFAGLNRDEESISDVPATAETTDDNPSWRSIPLERQHLATGLSQLRDHGKEYEGAAFFTTDSFVEELSQQLPKTQPSSIQSVEDVLSQFYEKSYAIHEDIPSSQIASSGGIHSFYTNESSSYEEPSVDSYRGKDVPVASDLTSLKNIPNARYLDSIQPQTKTVNIIVGVIFMPPPRPIRTRRGVDVELVEVLVGDETKSGFAINFWFSSTQSIEGNMRSALSGLRPQDVVLLRNVALGSFKGKVCGQSLRKGMTKVNLLYRNRIDKTDVGGCYVAADLVEDNSHTQVQKTKRVREWVMKFVGGGPMPATREEGRDRALVEILPPDTQ